MQPLRARPIALLAVALAAALVVAFRAPLWRALVAGIVDVMSGSQVAFSEMHLSAGSFELDHLEVRHGGEPLLAAERVVIRYDSGAFFRGARRLGLESLLLERPQLFIVRRRDGSFNLPLGGGPGPGGETNAPNVAPPMRLDAEVRDGQAVVIDPGRVDPAARRIALEHLSLHARIDSAGRSSYAASARYEGKSLRLKGSVDAVRGYALHRLQADEVPIATVLNYIINLRSAYVHAGVLRALDVRAYGFGGGAFGEHLTGSARLSGGVMDIPGLRVPLRDVEAPLDLYDDGVLSPRIAASEAGVPVLAAGGIYDWHAPEFRLGMRARGPLQTFRTVFRFSREMPLSGSAAVAGLVEGPVGDPLVIVRVSAAHAAYGKFPID